MNKDAILATLIGFGIGLLITGLLILAPNIMNMLPPIKLPNLSFTPKNQTQGPTPTPSPSPNLAVESPLPEEILHNASLLVSGTTLPTSTVVIAGFQDEIVVVTKDDGKFAGKITLVEGKNGITVLSYTPTEQFTQNVTVYYTPEEL